MIDYKSAILDLKFIEGRLRNILNLIPFLDENSSIIDGIEEGKKSLQNLKTEVQNNLDTKASLEKSIEDTKLQHDILVGELEDRRKAIASDIEQTTSVLHKQAEDKAKSIINEAEQRVASLDSLLREKEETLSRINSDIEKAEHLHQDVLAKIENIRNSL